MPGPTPPGLPRRLHTKPWLSLGIDHHCSRYWTLVAGWWESRSGNSAPELFVTCGAERAASSRFCGRRRCRAGTGLLPPPGGVGFGIELCLALQTYWSDDRQDDWTWRQHGKPQPRFLTNTARQMQLARFEQLVGNSMASQPTSRLKYFGNDGCCVYHPVLARPAFGSYFSSSRHQ